MKHGVKAMEQPAALFRRGDRVRLSAEGLSAFHWRTFTEWTRGTVVGLSRDGQCIRVKRDGLKSIDRFHASFWEIVEPDGSGASR